jgi:hypothetical protein
MAKVKTTNDGVKALSDYLDYCEARERAADLRRQLATAETELAAAVQSGEKRSARVSDLEAQARQLAGLDEPTPERDRPPDLRGLEERQRVLQTAVEIAGRRLEELWIRTSADILGTRRSEHVELVQRIAGALEDLKSAMMDEEAWLAGLRDEGLHVRLGSGGLESYQSVDTRVLFKLLRGLKIDVWKGQLRKVGYLK